LEIPEVTSDQEYHEDHEQDLKGPLINQDHDITSAVAMLSTIDQIGVKPAVDHEERRRKAGIPSRRSRNQS
jgi:hypothetical protein